MDNKASDEVDLKKNDLDEAENEVDSDGEEKKTTSYTLHMDTCKMKHEETANQTNSI